jgi:hypothetical protein
MDKGLIATDNLTDINLPSSSSSIPAGKCSAYKVHTLRRLRMNIGRTTHVCLRLCASLWKMEGKGEIGNSEREREIRKDFPGDENEEREGRRGETSPASLDPPPVELEPIFFKARHSTKPGDSTIGVSVLAVKGWVETVEGEPLNIRLDSCADITLLSEEYYQSMTKPPPLRIGRRMSLAQLMDQGTVIKG